MKPFQRKPVLIFLILTLVLSALMYYLIFDWGKNLGTGLGFLSLALKWCPALAAVLTSLICYQSIKNLGWGLHRPRRLLLVYFLPLLYGMVVYGLVWITGLGEFSSDTGAWMVSPAGIFQLLIMAVIGVGISVLGEEIGWRGFLVPELAKDVDWIDTAMYSGVITLAWFSPWIILGNGTTNAPMWYNWLCFALMTLGLSLAYTWLRLKSSSLWVPFLLHAGHNFIIGMILDGLTINKGITFYFSTEFGAGLALTGLLTGFFFYRLGDPVKKDQPAGDLAATPAE